MGLLPPRPLRLDSKVLSRRRLKKTALAAFVGVVGLGFTVGCVFFAREVLEERRLWNQGTEGRVLNYSGRVEESRLLFLTFAYDYKLDVSWMDARGARRNGPSRFSLMFKPIAKDDEPSLRYDPSAPDRFVLSWAALAGFPRYGWPLFFAALALLESLASQLQQPRGPRLPQPPRGGPSQQQTQGDLSWEGHRIRGRRCRNRR